jgi:hypothetical protein
MLYTLNKVYLNFHDDQPIICQGAIERGVFIGLLSAEDAGHHFGMFTFEISLCIMFK